MRVIAGKFKGQRLLFSKSFSLRPTQDRVKETLFNMIQGICEDAICLDLFCGTGSLGIESLSRGATSVDFVDIDTRYIQKNINLFDTKLPISIYKESAFNYVKQTQKLYDIIFLDPPWSKLSYFERALKGIFDFDILNNEGLIICEHPNNISDFHRFSVEKQKSFGNKMITLLRK